MKIDVVKEGMAVVRQGKDPTKGKNIGKVAQIADFEDQRADHQVQVAFAAIGGKWPWMNAHDLDPAKCTSCELLPPTGKY